jgi:hypothetical protein
MLIEANFNEVPDKVLAIPTGIYDLLCEKIEVKAPNPRTDGKPTAIGNNVVFSWTVAQEGPNKGRKITDYIFISADPKLTADERARNLVGIKRVAMSAGIPVGPNGLNVMEIQGKVVKAQITTSVGPSYRNPAIQVEQSNISKYFIPGDPEMSTTTTA